MNDLDPGFVDVNSRLPETPALIEMKQSHHFPTQIFSMQLDTDIANIANSALLNLIYAERERDRVGIQRSNFNSLGGWHSHNDLHRDPSYSRLSELISACCASLSEQNGYDRSFRLAITSMWAIINAPGSSNRSHIHPASLWSGVYYVQVPKDSGDIEFTDPRTQQLMNPPRFIPNRKRPTACWSKVDFTPMPGLLLIFPSWLYHSVAPNLSKKQGAEGERIIVSFNLSQLRSTSDEVSGDGT